MKLSKANIPFTMVANEVLERPDISFQVKGLFAYLFSKPEGWEFSADRIAKRESTEDRKTIQRLLKKMEQAGLLVRQRKSDGKMDYRLEYSSRPVEELTQRLFTFEGKTEVESVKIIDIKSIESPIDRINDLIAEFEPVNPSFKRLFANKTQRAAMARLTQSIGFDKARGAIKAAVASCGKTYAPTITTPIQLEDRIGALAAFMKRNQHKEAAVFTI